MDFCGHLLKQVTGPDGRHSKAVFVHLVFQFGAALDAHLCDEFESPDAPRDRLRARRLQPTEMSETLRARRVASHIAACGAAFADAQWWSCSTDAARAGNLNRQNTAISVAANTAMWGLPVVLYMWCILHLVFSLYN